MFFMSFHYTFYVKFLFVFVTRNCIRAILGKSVTGGGRQLKIEFLGAGVQCCILFLDGAIQLI